MFKVALPDVAHHLCAWSWRDGCEQSCWCWDSNPGPLEEQPAFLTAEVAAWPRKQFLKKIKLIKKKTKQNPTHLLHARPCPCPLLY